MPKLHVKNYKRDMVYLFVLIPGPAKTSISLSPFGTKLKAWLDLVGIPYEMKQCTLFGPTKQSPFIELNGRAYGDSGTIIKMLEEKFNVQLEDHLSTDEKATSVFIQRLVEDHLMLFMPYYRILDNPLTDGPEMIKLFAAGAPSIAHGFILRKFRKGLNQRLRSLLSLPEGDRMALLHDDLSTLSSFLGEKRFVFGDKPTRVDTSLEGMVGCMMDSGLKNEGFLKQIQKYPNLIRHHESFKKYLLDQKNGTIPMNKAGTEAKTQPAMTLVR